MQNQIQELLENQKNLKKVASDLQTSSYTMMAIGYRDGIENLFEQGVLISLILHYLGLEDETDEKMVKVMKDANLSTIDRIELCDKMIAVSETLEANFKDLVKIPA